MPQTNRMRSPMLLSEFVCDRDQPLCRIIWNSFRAFFIAQTDSPMAASSM